jgi:hypothetical protein
MEPEFHLISLLFYLALLLSTYLSSEQAQFTHCRCAKRRGVIVSVGAACFARPVERISTDAYALNKVYANSRDTRGWHNRWRPSDQLNAQLALRERSKGARASRRREERSGTRLFFPSKAGSSAQQSRHAHETSPLRSARWSNIPPRRRSP